MKVCAKCGRSYGDAAVVCAYDGAALGPAAVRSSAASRRGNLESGDVLGAYRVLGRIGIGGMGVIYRAEHVRLGRKVALKVLKPELSTRADVIRRFFTEARAVNEIGHPNIVDIIDFVEDANESPPLIYMVMELLSGQDLAARIQAAGPLDPAEVVEIGRQVADALIAVHRVKILHRDLKPENIFLCRREDSAVQVKLLDFGVARAFGQREEVRITDPGTAIGTPEYMAPEQILGRELDDRTDIYGLGLVFYDMLTNSVPFQSSNYGEIMVQQVKEAPPPLSARRKEGARVPPGLEQLVMRCLRKDPAERFQNMRDMRAALEVCLTAEVAQPLSSVDTALVETPLRRVPRRWIIAGVTVCCALAGGGLGVLAVRAWRRTPAGAGSAESRGGAVARAVVPAAVPVAVRRDAGGPVPDGRRAEPDLGGQRAAEGRKAQGAGRRKRPPAVRRKTRKSLEGTVDPFAQ
jgi:serine/threonine-protein kinase